MNKAKVMQMRILRVKKTIIKECYRVIKTTSIYELTIHNENSGNMKQNGKAKKSAGRMPWHWEPMKDVINCDKLRGVVSTL